MRRRRKYRIPSEDPEGFDVRMFARSIRSHFFDKETMEYFGSKLEEWSVFPDGDHGAFFVTSEQLTSEVKKEIMGFGHRIDTSADPSMDKDEPRQWKVRYANYRNRSVATYGDKLFPCLAGAEAEARRLAEILVKRNSCTCET